ncbi:MAG: hypothetical protein NC324_00685 [Bacteroides sp.]|nr:hypothetical protein [Bacteroides sp.]
MKCRFSILVLIFFALQSFTQAQTDAVSGASISPDMRERLKAELKAELLEELRGELAAEGTPVKTSKTTAAKRDTTRKSKPVFSGPRLQIGGYGEAVMTRNFFSDNYLRYKNPDLYKNEQHGRFDLPHVVLWLGYDFGRGWSFGSEIEFEHGGTESAVEIEEEEGGEYESEIERGGEVALEQFWIQKSFSSALNIRAGHIIVPVGATNAHHMPTEFFGVYRPEGENTIIPCTWHETGISFWGEVKGWRYEVMFLAGLDADRFNSKGWIHDGSGSPYEFKIGTSYAGAFRVDNTSVPGLRLSLSGYVGNSFKNTLYAHSSARWDKVRGTVGIGAFDFAYNDHNVIIRGNATYGHLSDSKMITAFNSSMSSSSVSSKQAVASDAIAVGGEIGYDFFSLSQKLHERGQKFYLFGRYDYYDSMLKTEDGVPRRKWCGRQRAAVGVNYMPIKNIAIKAEYAIGILNPYTGTDAAGLPVTLRYNNEPSISLGITYSGLFEK